VGGALWAASAAAVAGASRGLRLEADDGKVPLMGVAGAFVFAAQMVNFAVPGTGSSGHIGGGLLLAVLLGPDAALLVMTSVLAVQALFFADGGLLALGANVFNLGIVPAYLVVPLFFRPLAGRAPGTRRWAAATVLSAVLALQLGAFGVVLETTLSRISALPFVPFLLAMQPIHLAIGLVEGFATVAVLGFVAKARPEVLDPSALRAPRSLRPVLVGLLAGALLAGGALAHFASKKPDGLEWSVERTSRRALGEAERPR
jgi:cobalt/nickel transport system permease protein